MFSALPFNVPAMPSAPKPLVPPRFVPAPNPPPQPHQLVPVGAAARNQLPPGLAPGGPQALRLPTLAQARIPHFDAATSRPPTERFTPAYRGVPGAAQAPNLAGLGDIFDDLKTQFEPANLVAAVELNTTLYDFRSERPLKPAPGPTYGSAFMRFLKPQIKVELSPVFGRPLAPIVVAPWGPPVEDKTAQAVLVVGGLGTLGLALYGLKKLVFG